MTRDQIIAANPIAEFARNRGNMLKRAGENFVTSGCPVTQHKQRGHLPVTIYPVTQSWHCHDCKVGGTVVDWLMHEKSLSPAEALRVLGGGRNGSEPDDQRRVDADRFAAYDYVSESGELLYQVCRFKPKAFRQRRPDGKNGWISNVNGVPRVLYQLPKVIPAQTVAVVEGEKDADSLTRLRIMATTNSGGAGKWRDEYSKTLRGKDVVIIGDRDEPGEAHVEQVLESLTGRARSIKRVSLPDDFHDISDYIASLPKDTAAQAIAKLIDETPVLNSFDSFNSLARKGEDEVVVDDFPEPLSEVAFCGLAGDIVRRIEEHTEADRAALLIQILAAFGSITGRSAFMVADGCRHYMNLFVVLVGASSKSRKGTSLAHIKRILGRADESWLGECLTSGLSSGEGLIYEVRDPVTKRVRQKNGSYSDEITDSGVSDKRRTFVESELSSALRVMSREGNTLSSVIRAAWDDGHLRTAVKNSPNRASGAHVSIIGHVTRDEVRRELNATDQANGFANRFLWLAVRRSKCLPEGGHIAGENLNDLVTQLHKAIAFARNAGEVTRDEEARELWRTVYPELSEGKPGLLGAITARAEAQVLRLSCIYALLDCSTKISVDHHRAALALWNYCDRSARWIFGTATGDTRADRILIGLRIAGRNGMTQTEISERIFNRNVLSNTLSDALRLLQRSGQIRCTKESTGGGPRKRWIATES